MGDAAYMKADYRVTSGSSEHSNIKGWARGLPSCHIRWASHFSMVTCFIRCGILFSRISRAPSAWLSTFYAHPDHLLDSSSAAGNASAKILSDSAGPHLPVSSCSAECSVSTSSVNQHRGLRRVEVSSRLHRKRHLCTCSMQQAVTTLCSHSISPLSPPSSTHTHTHTHTTSFRAHSRRLGAATGHFGWQRRFRADKGPSGCPRPFRLSPAISVGHGASALSRRFGAELWRLTAAILPSLASALRPEVVVLFA